MLTDKFKKARGPELDESAASQMLENIFDACEVEPNTVPLSVLKSYSNYRRERFLLQKVLLVIILFFFCMVPLFFIAPNMQLILKDHGTNGKPAYELVVDTFIPVSRITASIGGSNIPVYEVADKTYSIEPTLNGTMTVTVTLKNRQFASITCEVSGVDTTSPVVLSDKQVGDQIYLYLSDPGSGVDYDNISALDIDGNEVEPVSFDEGGNYIIFDYPEKSLNIYVPDKAGNTLHLILTIRE